jgi:hypothetical protein
MVCDRAQRKHHGIQQAVWFGKLGWSGSWRMNVERTSQNLVRITAGL